MAASDKSNEKIVEDAFLRIYCRLPTAAESQKALATLPAREQRRPHVEDLYWALLNTPEFYFID